MGRQHYGDMNNPYSQCGRLYRIFKDQYPVGHPIPSPCLARVVGSLSIASVASGLRAQLKKAGVGYDIVNSLKVKIIKHEDGTKERKVDSFFKMVPVER